MKRRLSWLLLGALIFSLCGCNTAPVQTTEPTEAETVSVLPDDAAEEEPELTEPVVLEESLFLKVSSINFSLVGESDDIYLGLVPRELITWESDDPDIVSVDNGVLTATGVGTTTIRATYADRSVTCAAGCLAQTPEELQALGWEVLSKPKRLPPNIDLSEPCTYFDNAAIVGDSITYILSQRESKTNYLGNILFLARGGTSMKGFVRHYMNIFYRGAETYLEDAIAQSQVERVYFLMGSNDVGSEENRDGVFENWTIMLERIRNLSPDVEIVIFSQIPEYDRNGYCDKGNDVIEAYNEQLKVFAAENDCMFLDLAYYIQDHYERMPKIYSLDDYHLNEAGCNAWVQMMRFYAQYEAEGGVI